MGCLKVIEGGFRKMQKRREGCGIFSAHLLWRWFPKISHPHSLSTPIEQPNQPQIGLGVDSGV